MFTREESKKVRQEFWTSFAKEYPRKWRLYNTGLKELDLKFTFTTEHALVSLDISSTDDILEAYYWEKLEALNAVLLKDYLLNAIYDSPHRLPEAKLVRRVYVEYQKVNIHRKKDWDSVQKFLADNMTALEAFYADFEDFIRN